MFCVLRGRSGGIRLDLGMKGSFCFVLVFIFSRCCFSFVDFFRSCCFIFEYFFLYWRICGWVRVDG